MMLVAVITAGTNFSCWDVEMLPITIFLRFRRFCMQIPQLLSYYLTLSQYLTSKAVYQSYQCIACR